MTSARLQTERPGHYPQLDSIRAVAVTLVMAHHLWIGSGRMAIYGVKLFFVISGFLITQILLSSRTVCGDAFMEQLTAIGRFYARRSLRIFPLYYMVVCVALLAGLSPAADIVGWLLSYLLNFKMASQDYYEAEFAHFWSLCVEEQFYLFWPWIVLLVPQRGLVSAAVSLVVGAIAFRVLYVVTEFSLTTGLGTYILPFASLDSLGLGALLAIAAARREPQEISKALRIAVPLALALLAVTPSKEGDWTSFILSDVFLGIVFCGIVWLAVRSTQGILCSVMSFSPIVYLGKISYGVYVLHPFAPTVLKWAWWRPELPLERFGAFTFFCVTASFSVLLASLSWYAFESPLNALKKHFRDPLTPS